MELKDLSAHDLEVLKAAVTTQGFVQGMGLEAIHLDALAKLAYNIFYPELRKIPHIQPEMAGQRWGGTSYQWKSILNPNASSLPAPVSPRNAIASIESQSYAANYVTLGYDQSVQDEEYEQERGFDDPVKNARITTMHNILRMYDIMATDGNRGQASDGFGGNGFVLGSAGAPSLIPSSSGGTIGAGVKVTVYCVELTSYSMLPFINGALDGSGSPGYAAAHSGHNGLIQTITRTPANSSTSETIPAGTGILGSPTSQVVGSSTSTNSVAASVTPTVGAFGWAWYVSVNGSPSTANAYFYSVTRSPEVTVLAPASASNQAASTLAATDYSFNSAGNNASGADDFDGAFAWIAGSQNAATAGFNQFINLLGAGFTSDGAGGVTQLESAILNQFNANQAVPDEIVCGVNAITPLSAAVLGISQAASGYRIFQERGANGEVSGATVINSYRLKFSPDGNQRMLPVSVSPNIPANAVWLPTRTNPFPSTSATIPAVLQLAEIKPMYSIDYAKTRRTWELGTYVQTTLVNRAPFIGIVFAGAGY